MMENGSHDSHLSIQISNSRPTSNELIKKLAWLRHWTCLRKRDARNWGKLAKNIASSAALTYPQQTVIPGCMLFSI